MIASRLKQLDDPDRGDLCFHVLVAADQLLISRLKSLCEVAIADHVMTLKNAADVLQFAVTYNAAGLRDRAAQFLCLNIATLMEKKALDGLSYEAMEVGDGEGCLETYHWIKTVDY